MKSIKSIISVILVFTMAFTFIACNEDEGENTTAEISTAPATAPESASDHITEELAETNASIEDSAREPAGTNEPAEDTAEPEETEVPAEDTAAPETKAPAEDTAKAPTSTPAEDTTKAPTTKPVETTAPEETTAHILMAPPEDPSIDYSQWGKYGFEKMLPEPLPYSDQEADWQNARFDYAPNMYVIGSMNRMYSTDEERKACYEILDEYANSLKKYGYDLSFKTARFWELTDNFNNMIVISLDDNDNNHIFIEITFA